MNEAADLSKCCICGRESWSRYATTGTVHVGLCGPCIPTLLDQRERLCKMLAALAEANETEYTRPNGSVDLSLAARAAGVQQQAHDLLAEIGMAECGAEVEVPHG